MAKAKAKANGSLQIEQALTHLINNEAALVGRQSETDRRLAEADQKFAAIIQVLGEHTRLLERLPEAIREKIGFPPQGTSAPVV